MAGFSNTGGGASGFSADPNRITVYTSNFGSRNLGALAFGSNGGATGADAGTGQAIRRLTEIEIESFLNDRPPLPIEVPEQEAEIRWGRASNFSYDPTIGDYSQVENVFVTPITNQTFNTYHDNRDDDDDDDEVVPEDQEITTEFPEITRTVETIRVTQPGHPENYVDIERIKDITFQAPNSGQNGEIINYWKFILNWGQASQ